jgi:heme-degrading monooxygenase HmoA
VDQDHVGQTLVVFLSLRTGVDDAGYAEAAAEMAALAAMQPGYRGIESARGDDQFGITISFWADEASAIAWRKHPRHTEIREAGRGRWYARYEVIIAEATRGYGWQR